MSTPAPGHVPFELASLAGAVNYQRWIADSVMPYLGSRILEIGAGIGNLSQWLPAGERLFVTESEPQLLADLKIRVQDRFNGDPRVSVGSLDLGNPLGENLRSENFDTVVSFNVLEHIEDDAAALARLAELLAAGNAKTLRIVSLVPAHAWAYGAMDRSYGHFRRYSNRSFADLARRTLPDWDCYSRYFNVLGLPGWVVMGRLLQKERIDPRAVDAFDRLCPYIRTLDDFAHERLRLPFGQSLLAVLTLVRP